MDRLGLGIRLARGHVFNLYVEHKKLDIKISTTTQLNHESTCIMSRTLKVNCIIDGDSDQEIFTIQIAAIENISALRDEIKIRREDLFRNIVAVELTLHPAFTTYEKIKDLKLPLATLNPLFRLSEVFANLNPKEIHVIITRK